MPIYLLDDSLSVDIFYECDDSSFSDCVCVSIVESVSGKRKTVEGGRNQHIHHSPRGTPPGRSVVGCGGEQRGSLGQRRLTDVFS